jgi:glycosyltransferase involved in cell wall biosynthesis
VLPRRPGASAVTVRDARRAPDRPHLPPGGRRVRRPDRVRPGQVRPGRVPGDKIVVKPNFILEDRGPGTGGGGYALYVGRLDEGKGIEVLLPAWQQVRGDFELRILGDGMLAPLVRAAAERDPRIRYLGRRPMDEVFAAMGEAAFMVLSSVWYEGLPKTVVEAFSRGTPIVASALGALAELIEPGKTGLHFRPGDAADLARQMQWALEHPAALAAMRSQCRARFEERYTAVENAGSWKRVTGVQSGNGTFQPQHRSANSYFHTDNLVEVAKAVPPDFRMHS